MYKESKLKRNRKYRFLMKILGEIKKRDLRGCVRRLKIGLIKALRFDDFKD